MEDTYESELLYRSICSEHVPTPIAWGSYADQPDTWFYICEFHDMDMEKLDPSAFVNSIAGYTKQVWEDHRSVNADSTFQLILLTYRMTIHAKTQGNSGILKPCRPCMT